ncbi:hypothetical protein [Chryseobacterium hagamense]|uniref:Uncharacterized protein n=1 Tax=Chryseobacterium hagamense TaxID=395935 RepID=A0A511YIP7_9FLAO|nr:hypothetical protein [Chryseobacterium hagamense]GEN75074.1 hypothetical protein CHA01nite_08140 [Chryseobacterium hagamense]
MKKNIKVRSKILLITLFCYFNFFQSQDLKVFSPILISNLPNGNINNEKVNKVVLDYYNPNVKDMQCDFLKYSSDDKTVYIFDQDKKVFKSFLSFQNNEKIISKENFLGIFRNFTVVKENEKSFKVISSTGNYPSHFEKINSIEILEKSKRFLILKVNYSDVYDFKGYGVLVLQDYK